MCEEDSLGLHLAYWEETNEESSFHHMGKTTCNMFGCSGRNPPDKLE